MSATTPGSDYGQFISTSKMSDDDAVVASVPTHRILLRELAKDVAEAVHGGLSVDIGSIKYFIEHEGLRGAGYTFSTKKVDA